MNIETDAISAAVLHRIPAFGNSGMAKVEIYTWRSCPFCIRAKALLDRKRINYVEYAIDGDNAARSTMAERADGRTTVPQIFIDDQGIGGCDELHALDRAGELESLLQGII